MFSDKWHYRFMEVAKLVSTWSKDTSTKTGAVVVGPDREIRATGYNGLVRGVDDNIPERCDYSSFLCILYCYTSFLSLIRYRLSIHLFEYVSANRQ